MEAEKGSHKTKLFPTSKCCCVRLQPPWPFGCSSTTNTFLPWAVPSAWAGWLPPASFPLILPSPLRTPYCKLSSHSFFPAVAAEAFKWKGIHFSIHLSTHLTTDLTNIFECRLFSSHLFVVQEEPAITPPSEFAPRLEKVCGGIKGQNNKGRGIKEPSKQNLHLWHNLSEGAPR